MLGRTAMPDNLALRMSPKTIDQVTGLSKHTYQKKSLTTIISNPKIQGSMKKP